MTFFGIPGTVRPQKMRELWWIWLCGSLDKYVAHEQAVWIVDRLQAATVPAELLTLDGAGHGFKGADAEKAEKALFEFFDRHLKE